MIGSINVTFNTQTSVNMNTQVNTPSSDTNTDFTTEIENQQTASTTDTESLNPTTQENITSTNNPADSDETSLDDTNAPQLMAPLLPTQPLQIEDEAVPQFASDEQPTIDPDSITLQSIEDIQQIDNTQTSVTISIDPNGVMTVENLPDNTSATEITQGNLTTDEINPATDTAPTNLSPLTQLTTTDEDTEAENPDSTEITTLPPTSEQPIHIQFPRDSAAHLTTSTTTTPTQANNKAPQPDIAATNQTPASISTTQPQSFEIPLNISDLNKPSAPEPELNIENTNNITNLGAITELLPTNNPEPTPLTSSANISIPVDHPGWSDEIADKIIWFGQQNVTTAQLHLNPPELGPLTAHITIDDGKATISFLSQHQQVLNALENTTPKLNELFQSAGIDLGDVNVSHQQGDPYQQQQALLAYQENYTPAESIHALQPFQDYQPTSTSRIDFYAWHTPQHQLSLAS